MTHDEIAELLGAYALDAVDHDERVAIEDHLVDCVRCRAEYEEFREVTALLAEGGTAPDGVWDRIAGSLEAPPPPLELRARRPRRTWPQATVALAAAAAIVVAVLGVQVHRQDDRISDLQSALRSPMAPAYHDALADPASDVVNLTSADGHVVARIAVTRAGTAYLGLDDLPRLAADRTYQLWGRAGDALVSLGVLGNDPTIVAVPASNYSLFAITEEVAAGVVQTHNTPIATATVSA
jgi:anti-sigma factor RsiW